MQGTAGDSVGVWDVAPRNGAQTREIEVGILCNQRIEGPLDEGNPAGQGVSPPDIASIGGRRRGLDGRARRYRHVRVQEGFSGSPAGDGHCESHETVAVKCAEYLPSSFRGNDK